MSSFSTTRHRPLRLTSSLLLLLCSSAVASPLALIPSWQPDQAQNVLGDKASAQAPAPRRLNGKFLHITDFHPDEFYKVHSSTSEGVACHRGKGPAGTYGAETSDCDTPFSLINATFDWIAENIRDDVDFVIWTGDNARHDSDEKIPRSPGQVQFTNQYIADKFVDVFGSASGKGMDVPVIPTLGNNDILPHNVLLPGPNKWLKRYTDIWDPFIPEEQRHSFEYGGWFYVEVIPNHLAVFSVNSLYFFDRNAGIDDCVNPTEPGFKQLEWMRIQLQFMRERGVKVILMGHVPPARTGSKQLWDETCWQKYTLWLRQYRDVIVASFYGHMNIDHFLFQDTKEINYALVGAVDEEDDEATVFDEDYEEPEIVVRTSMDDEMTIESASDYLQELRSGWSKLPKPLSLAKEEHEVGEASDEEMDALKKKKKKGDKKKKKKGKGPKLSRKWSERYQVSMVSPSIVPNYLPTLRVLEYNISGLEDAPVWTDGPSKVPVLPDDGSIFGESKKKKGKKDKKKKKNPNLVVPEGPSKTAVPGPAYSPQPLTLVGYTQYFANLTYINNDMTLDSVDEVEGNKWHEGKHSDKTPKKKPAKPHAFKFDVEYSTFTDKIYGLTDLTVNSFMEIAYRMGQKTSGKIKSLESDFVEVDDEEEFEVDEVDEEDSDEDVTSDLGDVDASKKKKKKNKKKKKQNKMWLHFLRHAFVTTVDRKELKKISK